MFARVRRRILCEPLGELDEALSKLDTLRVLARVFAWLSVQVRVVGLSCGSVVVADRELGHARSASLGGGFLVR